MTDRNRMANVEESRRPVLSRFVLEFLGLQPGPVTGVLLVTVLGSSQPEAIFHALHNVKSLVTGPISYVVNSSQRAQLIVRCTNPAYSERLDIERVTFKHDDKVIMCFNLQSVSFLPLGEDNFYQINVQEFFARQEGLSIFNYPRGFSGVMYDMDLHLNPTLSASTMGTLGLQEGFVDRLLKVDIKYLGIARDFLYVLRIANIPNAQFVVDEDGSMYMKFQNRLESDMTAMYHFFVERRMMIKFYKVLSMKKRNVHFDSSVLPIYWRARRGDTWSPIVLG